METTWAIKTKSKTSRTSSHAVCSECRKRHQKCIKSSPGHGSCDFCIGRGTDCRFQTPPSHHQDQGGSSPSASSACSSRASGSSNSSGRRSRMSNQDLPSTRPSKKDSKPGLKELEKSLGYCISLIELYWSSLPSAFNWLMDREGFLRTLNETKLNWQDPRVGKYTKARFYFYLQEGLKLIPHADWLQRFINPNHQASLPPNLNRDDLVGEVFLKFLTTFHESGVLSEKVDDDETETLEFLVEILHIWNFDDAYPAFYVGILDVAINKFSKVKEMLNVLNLQKFKSILEILIHADAKMSIRLQRSPLILHDDIERLVSSTYTFQQPQIYSNNQMDRYNWTNNMNAGIDLNMMMNSISNRIGWKEVQLYQRLVGITAGLISSGNVPPSRIIQCFQKLDTDAAFQLVYYTPLSNQQFLSDQTVEELEILALGLFANYKILDSYLNSSRLAGNDYSTLVEFKRSLMNQIGEMIELCCRAFQTYFSAPSNARFRNCLVLLQHFEIFSEGFEWLTNWVAEGARYDQTSVEVERRVTLVLTIKQMLTYAIINCTGTNRWHYDNQYLDEGLKKLCGSF